jgi:hypothetical protein
MTWLLKNLGVDDVVIGDLVEQHQAGRSRGWFWRQALTATLRAARTSALLTLGAAVLGWIVLWVFFGFLLVPLGQLDGYVVASGWAEQYSAGWWLRGIAMWIVMGFPFLASGWIVAKLAWRTPLLPILTFAASVSAVVLIALILDTGPTERFDLRVWLTVPLFLMVAPATAITVGGILAASSSKLNRFDAGR